MFRETRRVELKLNWHQDLICDALERVLLGRTKRLIINVPPRSGKTELAVKNFMAWAGGLFPDSEFIHASYSKRLASANTYAVRALMQSEAYAEAFPWVKLKGDSTAKDEFRTSAGGVFYATGADGTITGYGAGKMRDGFGGCFPSDQLVETEHGPREIGDLVRSGQPVRVWSYSEKEGKYELRNVQRFWKNPANDIVEVGISDGSTFRCTPDHEILTSQGWLSAIHLSQSLDLVNGEACSVAGGLPGERPVYRNLNDAITVLWLCVPDSVRQVLSDRLPSLSQLDLSDDAHDDTEPLSQTLAVIGALEYFAHGGSAELCTGPIFENRERSVSNGVLHVLRLCAIRKVQQSIIRGVTVEVADLVAFRSFANEVLRDQVSHVSHGDSAMDGEINALVTLPVAGRLKKSERAGSTNPAHVGNIVNAFGSEDRKPVFVRYDGHVDETFCLEVEGNHNFILSQSGAVVSNCIIIDDPHKAGEGTSEVQRQNVIDWFQMTMESRRNTPDTPIIVIMQRLHEEDLSGWLLAGGNGEEWEHLKIPALTEDEQSFWPEQFPIEMLQRQEHASRYVFAGQYMQDPVPRGGAMFQRDWFSIVPAAPAGCRWVRGWDLAGSEGRDSAYTAGILMGRSHDGRYFIADATRAQVTGAGVERLIVNTAGQDAAEHPGVRGSIPQDPGSAGKSWAQHLIKQIAPHNYRASTETGEKATRAEGLSAQAEGGNVYLVSGDWNKAFLDEITTFPVGKRKDQVDAASRAFSELAETPPQTAMLLKSRHR